jgi:hypothetical protein
MRRRNNIDFYNTSINYWVWLKFKTNNTTTAIITAGDGIMERIPSNKAICINTRINSRIKFTPYSVNDN